MNITSGIFHTCYILVERRTQGSENIFVENSLWICRCCGWYIIAKHIQFAQETKVLSHICVILSLCIKFGIVTNSFTQGLLIPVLKQAISARERALCQLTVCFGFQSRSKRRKGHKSCAQQMYLELNYQVNC